MLIYAGIGYCLRRSPDKIDIGYGNQEKANIVLWVYAPVSNASLETPVYPAHIFKSTSFDTANNHFTAHAAPLIQ